MEIKWTKDEGVVVDEATRDGMARRCIARLGRGGVETSATGDTMILANRNGLDVEIEIVDCQIRRRAIVPLDEIEPEIRIAMLEDAVRELMGEGDED